MLAGSASSISPRFFPAVRPVHAQAHAQTCAQLCALPLLRTRTRQSLPPDATSGAARVVASGNSASSSWPTSFMSGMLSCSLFFCTRA